VQIINKIVKSGILFLAGYGYNKFAGLLSRLIVARLGKEEYGLFTLGFAIFSVSIILALAGMNTGLVRFLSYHRAKDDLAKMKNITATAIKACLFLSLGIGCALYLSSGAMAKLFFHNDKLIPVIKIFSLAIPFCVMTELLLSITIAFQEVKYFIFTLDFTECTVNLILISVFLMLGLGLRGVLFAFFLSQVLSFCLAVYFSKNTPFLFSLKTKIDWELIRYSWPLGLSNIIWVILFGMDTLMLGYFLDTVQVGIYSAAAIVVLLLFMLPHAISILFLPTITNLYSQEKDIGFLYKAVSKWLFYFNLPLAVIIICFSKEIIALLFGPPYLAASQAMVILTLGYLFCSFSFIHWRILWLHKKTLLFFLVNLALLVTNLALNCLLIQRYYLLGAALATTISFSILGFLSAILAHRLSRIRLWDKDYPKAILCAFLGVIALLILKTLKLSGIFHPILNLASMTILFLGIYIWGLILTKAIGKQDIELLAPDGIIVRGIDFLFNRRGH
jgi:O-antigen/teichoic acid export membrane protein